ncbi:MAG TPA: ABC transporter ATP-binding protein, partial [Roseiflexaceae bacterium]
MSRREFTVAGEHVYDRRSPARWIISHIMRYPLLPAVTLLGNVCTSALYNFGAILIGRAFDLVATPGVTVSQLLWLSLAVLAARCGVGVVDLGRVSAVETLAQRVE